MNILIKMERKDFEGNKEVFDRMYALCEALNKPAADKPIPAADVERAAGVEHAPEPVTKPTGNVTPEPDPAPEFDLKTGYTLEQVRKAFADLSKAKGKEAAKGILSEMGFARVPDLPEDKYAEAMARIEAVK